MSRRTALALVAVLAVVSACSGDDDDDVGTDSTVEAPPCTAETAEEVDRVVVGADGFSVRCARASAGTEFVFENGEDEPHNVTTRPDDPTPFNVTMPQAGFTYRAELSPGDYEITDDTNGESMQLFVEGDAASTTSSGP